MASYKTFICDVPDLGETLEEINEEGSEIIALTYASDSAQIVCIVKEAKSFLKEMKKSVEAKKEEPEEE